MLNASLSFVGVGGLISPNTAKFAVCYTGIYTD